MKWCGLLLGVLLPMSVSAQSSPLPQTFNAQTVNPQAIDGLPPSVVAALHNANLSGDSIGIAITAMNDNDTLLSYNADTPFVPASTNKLITTAAALDSLGSDFVWQTSIYVKGLVAGKVLYGDLIIKGGGDPSLSHERLDLLLGRVFRNIHHITGDIIIDNRAFAHTKYDVNAFDGQGTRAYNAYPSAFLLNYGTLEITFTPSGTYNGEQFVANDMLAAVSVQPEIGLSYQKTLESSDGCSTPTPKKYDNTLQLIGSFGAACGTQSIWFNLGDNEALAVQAIAHKWRKLDTAFRGRVKLATNETLSNTPLIIHNSEPLSKQIWRINQFSNNVMTEQVALSLPLYVNHQQISDYPSAFGFLNRWFGANIGKPIPVMSRASGLCYDCHITPKAMTALLGFMYHHKEFGVFLHSLPVAGQTGTMKALARRNPVHPAIGKAWLKTGTLNDVTAMAGYTQSQSGRWYSFVVMINAKGAGYNGSNKVIDELLAWTVER